MLRRIGILVAALAVLAAAAPAAAGTEDPGAPDPPTVTGPITGGTGEISLVTTSFDLLAEHGYVAEEYFLEGEATAYSPERPLSEDGRWQVEESGRAPYKTRMVVFRPEDEQDFNGTVYVEWLNVTAGFDTSAVWSLTHNHMMASGAAWIGVSAQAGGVQGSDFVLPGAAPGGVRGNDPERYGSLTHPGDLSSFDIFTQAGIAAAGDADGPKPLDGLQPERVIAIGKSQAAFRLVTYVDAFQPMAGVYDGFLIASRHASGSPFGATSFSLADDTVPETTKIRTDSDVPVLVVQTEGDLYVRVFESAKARQPDSKHFRLWEIAGTAHADTYSGTAGLNDRGDGAAELAVLDPMQLNHGPLSCAQLVNSGPAFAVVSAAVAQLDRWVRDGTPPPKADRIETTGPDDLVVTRDEHGNALGGIRSPFVDVPLTTPTGDANTGGALCFLFGTTTPFDAATLAALYPDGAADYQRQFAKSADKTVRDGFWLQANADNFKAASEQISFG
jgi:Alpha/beta hydrolase domain